MNPDNPTFRTPEEERRAEEFVRVNEENKKLKLATKKLIEALEWYAKGYNPDVVAHEDATLMPVVHSIVPLDQLGKSSGPFGIFDNPKRKLMGGKIARQALAEFRASLEDGE